MKISSLLLKYKTDKNYGTIDPDKGHFYGDSYDEIFGWFDRNKKWNILEIGVQKGGSLKAWKEFFPNASITGVDIVDVREKDYISPDFKFILSDIKKIDIKQYFNNTKFDIIIDDGSHFLNDVLFVVDNYLNIVNENGIIIVEDVQDPEDWMKKIFAATKTKTGCFELHYSDMRSIGHYDDFLIIIKRVQNTMKNKLFAQFSNFLKIRIIQLKHWQIKIKKLFK